MPEYDYIVIGGGSGGLASAKEASGLGAKVACFDYVTPSPHGSKWGVGGTCVNVGCVPKILMHYSARLGHSLHNDAKAFGWQLGVSPKFDWATQVQTVQNYIKQLNFGYRAGLRAAGVTYINAKAKLVEPNTVEYTVKGQTQRLSAKYILIAVGGRPHTPKEIPGVLEHAITSDDLFALKEEPGKTLVVGASYIALECAGFLLEMGYDVTICVRSIVLRGFDRQCAEKIATIMRELGAKFIMQVTVSSIEKVPYSTVPDPDAALRQTSHCLKVTLSTGHHLYVNTVLYATGRNPETTTLGCRDLGMQLHPLSGKVICDDTERTSIPTIYAVGDVSHAKPELTPVAIAAGTLLSRRLFGGSKKLMTYANIPTTVFTPVEYGCCGLSEEDAISRYGEDNIEIFLFEFNPIHVSAAHWEKHAQERQDPADNMMSPVNLSKLICKKDDLKVIGYHCIALNAGEITQGYALALKCGLTKHDIDEVIGIHPTDAEAFHNLTISRRSGQSWVAVGGCGGGKCG